MKKISCKYMLFSGLILILSLLSACSKEDSFAELFPVSEETKQTTQLSESEEDLEAGLQSDTAEPQTVFVYVCGQVENPNVYELEQGARIYEAVELAGPVLENASLETLNLAEVLTDGQKIYVPSKEEVSDQSNLSLIQETDSSQSAGGNSTLININTATKEQLMSLSGIGEAKADSIIQYRQENGGFSSVEDIMNISGIKDGVFQKIKDSITVN